MAFLNNTKIWIFLKRLSSTVAQKNNISFVSDLVKHKHLGLRANLKGWVKAVRKMKSAVFININDGSCCQSLQIVIPKDLSPKGLSYGSSVTLTGVVQRDRRGDLEILADDVNVLGEFDIAEGYPFTPGQNQFDRYRQYLHHRPKLLFFSSLLRVRHALTLEIHRYLNKNRFIGIHTPVFTANDCEGAGETFTVKPSGQQLLVDMKVENRPEDEIFFNTKTYLTVSGQFHLEVVTRSLPKVYTFNPVFRAENSKSRLHLSEFYMLEVEEAFVLSLTHVLSTIEDLVKNILSSLVTKYRRDFNYIIENNETVTKDHLSMLHNMIRKPFTVMTYSEAWSIVTKHMSPDKIRSSFTKEEELFLVKHNGNIPIFVVNWPRNLKPFYAKASKENPEEVLAVDLLVPVVGELCGGSVREDDYDTLKNKLTESNLLNDLHWYLEIRKFGNIPTGGFGIGFERFLQLALNITNIKDTIPFPRWPHNLQM